MNTAVIGIGCMGSAHAKSIFGGLVSGMTLAAVCDIDGARLEWAKKNLPGVPCYDDHRRLLAEIKPDAVIVAVPHRLHTEISVDALEAGAHLVCEKPAAVSVTDAQKIADTAKRTDRRYCIMFNQRTHPVFARAHELVRTGELGELKRVSWTVTNWYRRQEYYDSGSWRGSWSGEGGGVLINQAPHNLDLLQWICGMPDEVTAWCACGKYHDIEVEDEALLVMRKGDAIFTFAASTGEYPGTNRLEIAGTLGKLVVEDARLRLWRLPVSERELCAGTGNLPEPEYSEFSLEPEKDGHILVLEDFARAAACGDELLCPGDDAVKELTLSNAAYLSAWTGRCIKIPFDGAEFDRLLAEKSCGGAASPSGACNADGSYNPRWEVRW